MQFFLFLTWHHQMLPNGSSRLTRHLPRRHARCLIPINLSGISGVEWLRERNIFISMDRTEKCKAEADCAENVQLLPLFERNHNCHNCRIISKTEFISCFWIYCITIWLPGKYKNSYKATIKFLMTSQLFRTSADKLCKKVNKKLQIGQARWFILIFMIWYTNFTV